MRLINILTIILAAIILQGCSIIRSSSNNKETIFAPSDEISKARDDYERYVFTYYPLAVEQMEKYRIPASITLAQGLLESGAGKSKLARQSNNHFGIKADKNWKGKKESTWDNGKLCYFRKYESVRDSYEDHSLFLVGRSRYASLFKLDKTDYKGWAKGLRQAGYAEDRQYPSKLINLIEKYGLQKYDRYTQASIKGYGNEVLMQASTQQGRTIYKANGLLYIIADNGDTFKTLSDEFDISKRKLRKYNDLYKGYNICAGDIIYLEKKNSKAAKKYKFHTTKEGESLYLIAQKYGIRLKKLYKMNPQYENYSKLKVGDVIRLR